MNAAVIVNSTVMLFSDNIKQTLNTHNMKTLLCSTAYLRNKNYKNGDKL